MGQPLINKNFTALHRALDEGRRGIVLEGGSRSGKTWSVIIFLMDIITSNPFQSLIINIVKDTFAGFKTTLYNDFAKILDIMGERHPFSTVANITSFSLYGNKINFIGADQAAKFHGAASDYFWINEAIDVSQPIFDQLEMRCSRLWILDYNPKVSDHWIYNRLEKRTDVTFFSSTMLDNPMIGKGERAKILSYEPTPANIESGTADEYNWKVYGLGHRASPQGVIFPNIHWIDDMPTECDSWAYGMDFGYTNSPTAIVQAAMIGNSVYLKKLLYKPIDNPDDLFKVLSVIVPAEAIIWADAADPGTIKDMQRRGIRCYAAKKYPGSIQHGISLLKSYKLHIVRDADFRREAENYHWREIGGVALNEPDDDFNHLWDASRYAVQMEFNKKQGFTL